MAEDIREVVTDRAQITYRIGRSVGGFVEKSHLESRPPRQNWLTRPVRGVFRCGHCKACKWVKPSKKVTCAVSGDAFEIHDFINCGTTGLIYTATCGCPKDYVRKTIREWRKRILEHVGDITHKRDIPLATHIETVHGGNTRDLFFQPLEYVRPP